MSSSEIGAEIGVFFLDSGDGYYDRSLKKDAQSLEFSHGNSMDHGKILRVSVLACAFVACTQGVCECACIVCRVCVCACVCVRIATRPWCYIHRRVCKIFYEYLITRIRRHRSPDDWFSASARMYGKSTLR